jgi:hypothetical protein
MRRRPTVPRGHRYRHHAGGAARWVAVLAWISLAAHAAPTGSEIEPRYAIHAELRPLAVSVCGRYAIDATARYAPSAQSDDGRFVLTTVNTPTGGCTPFPDPVFADGFEAD